MVILHVLNSYFVISFRKQGGAMTQKMIGILLCLTMPIHAQWAFLSHKKFALAELDAAAPQNVLIFYQQKIPLFSQLLCAWNAVRPKKGHLSFFVQARNAHTQRWGLWHKMAEWGDVQRSHSSKSDGFSKNIHVRFETEPYQLADAFRIKVVGALGASIKNVRALAVTTANMHAFKSEDIKKTAKLDSVFVARVPSISQIALRHTESNKICSPVSCTMVTQHITKRQFDPLRFAKNSYDKGLGIYGSWPFNMAHAFECGQGNYWFYHTRLNSFIDLHRQLKRGLPIAVSVRGTLPGAPRTFPHGHLLVVIGWDKQSQKVICHDPSAPEHHQVEKRYGLKDFIAAWERSRRLAYWVETI